ncbi:MAG: hypothetical protein NDF55_02580 [archaeon GB-1867-005]|nr:hypothetical protein [Candidatus Culexmicrobium cathedralense]
MELIKVYIAPCGLGLGHASRSLRIGRRIVDLAEKLDVKPVILFSTYGSAVSLVARENYPVCQVPSINYFQKPDGTFDFKQTMSRGAKHLKTLWKQVALELKFISRFDPDVVISDSRLSTVIASKILGKPSLLVTNQIALIIPRTRPMTPSIRVVKTIAERMISQVLASMWRFSSRILIPDLEEKFAICRRHVESIEFIEDKVEFIGPIIGVRPEELPSRAELRRSLKLNVGAPIVFASISGVGFEKHFLAKVLVKAFRILCDEGYQVVLTLSNPTGAPVFFDDGRFRVLSWVDDYHAYLKACDVNINHAGHTSILEGICFGVPMLLIPARGHTERISNAITSQALGVARVLMYDELTVSSVLESIEYLLTCGKVKRSVKLLQELALKMDGAKRAAELAVNLAWGK